MYDPEQKRELLGEVPNRTQYRSRPIPKQYPELNFVITGDAGVGKRSLVNKFFEIVKADSLIPPEISHLVAKDNCIEEFSISPYDYNPNNAAAIPKYQLNFSYPTTDCLDPHYNYMNHYPRKTHIDGSIFVFDLTNQNSLHNIQALIMKLWRQKTLRTENIILVGNKSDLPRQISDREIQDIIMQHAAEFPIDYYETSASTGESVKDVFERLIQKHFYFAKHPPAL